VDIPHQDAVFLDETDPMSPMPCTTPPASAFATIRSLWTSCCPD
jgi:hypothetical protein